MRSVLKSLGALWLALLMSALLAGSSIAAKPYMEKINLDDPDDEAFWSMLLSDVCGEPISADIWGSVRIKFFTDRHGEFKSEIDKWFLRMRLTNSDTGESILIRDVGPDRLWLNKKGELMLAITGRSITGSGVIGRVVYNLDTGELVRQSGKVVGDWIDNSCAALT